MVCLSSVISALFGQNRRTSGVPDSASSFRQRLPYIEVTVLVYDATNTCVVQARRPWLNIL